jgi:hypothetical protein
LNANIKTGAQVTRKNVKVVQTILASAIIISLCLILGGLHIQFIHGINRQTSGVLALLAHSKAMASATTIQTIRMFP